MKFENSGIDMQACTRAHWAHAWVLAGLLFAVATPLVSANAATNGEVDLTRQLIRTVELNDWERADDLAATHSIRAMPDLLLWKRYRDEPESAEADELLAFLERRSNWPGLRRLRGSFEAMSPDLLNAEQRIRYFTQHEPRTREGRIALAEALFELGRSTDGSALIKRIWINDNFSRYDARFFLSLYGTHLDRDDHKTRLTRLLWDRRPDEASAMLDRVDGASRAVAIARIRLQRMARGVDAAINAIPQSHVGDPGLAFDRMQWRRRKGRESAAREILNNPPSELGEPSRWWPQQARAVRDLYDDGNESAARKLASKHGQETGSALAEAAWLAGWFDLRAGDVNGAEAEFLQFIDAVSTPISVARGAYWLARTYKRAGNQSRYDHWIAIALKHPTTFYGQAAARLHGTQLTLPDQVTATQDWRDIEDERADIAIAFCDAGDRQISEQFIVRIGLDEINNGTEGPINAIALAKRCKRPDLVIEMGKRLARQGEVPVQFSFPLPSHDSVRIESGVRSWSYAIMRQESHMDPSAQSSAGARGLMQLIPGTAKRVARWVGRPYGRGLLISDTRYNTTLGSAYFQHLLERFDGEAALALAGYNAGPSRVSTWLRRYGDPRGRDFETLIDWIESIPFAETRNYVQRVMEAQTVYALMIERGGGIEVDLEAPNGPVPINHPIRRPGSRPL